MVQSDSQIVDPFGSQKPKVSTEEVAESFDEKMKSLNLAAKEKETAEAAGNLGVAYINLIGFPISPETIALVPQELASELKAVCFFSSGSDLRIASTDPQNQRFLDLAKSLEKKYYSKATIYLISQHSFEFAYKIYKSLPKLKKAIGGIEITEESIQRLSKDIKTFRDLEKKIQEVSITDVLSLIIASAIKARASDIHIEAEEDGVKVRFRIDGILHNASRLDSATWPKVISRIKLISHLKINIEDRPQDGRFTIYLTKEEIDVRVSTLPTTYGESVVMRLLMSSGSSLAFEDLGLRGKAFEDLKIEISKPNGMVITTGPTGSGKTTTLYACINKLNEPGTKIITIEDPIEYKIPGISQSQIDRAKGYTFATGLRNILRQDPNIIMVGEIRDLETAEVSINASLTGHLVLSSLHTNDASGTIPRFLAMNVKPFLLAPAINAMVGQRLVRRICPHCRKEAEIDSQTLSRVLKILSSIPEGSAAKIPADKLKNIKFYKGTGCSECQGIGYQGRVGIFEVMVMNKEVENLILTGHVSEFDMREIGVKHGMVTMIQDGLIKATEGITTVEEIFRVAKDIADKL